MSRSVAAAFAQAARVLPALSVAFPLAIPVAVPIALLLVLLVLRAALPALLLHGLGHRLGDGHGLGQRDAARRAQVGRLLAGLSAVDVQARGRHVQHEHAGRGHGALHERGILVRPDDQALGQLRRADRQHARDLLLQLLRGAEQTHRQFEGIRSPARLGRRRQGAFRVCLTASVSSSWSSGLTRVLARPQLSASSRSRRDPSAPWEPCSFTPLDLVFRADVCAQGLGT